MGITELYEDLELMKVMASIIIMREIMKKLIQATRKFKRCKDAYIDGGNFGGSGALTFAENLIKISECDTPKGSIRGTVPAMQPSEDKLVDVKWVFRTLGAAETRSHMHL